jgi:hypothetical protein
MEDEEVVPMIPAADTDDPEDLEEIERAKKVREQIRAAFEDVVYPEGDNIYDGEDYRDYEGVKKHFLGKTWQEITPETVAFHFDDMALFTRPALSYFLPAFLLEDLKENDASQGMIRDFLLYQITDEIERNKHLFDESGYPLPNQTYPNFVPDGSSFHVNGDGMTREQVCGVRDYLEFIHWTYAYDSESAVHYALVHHWRPLVDGFAAL